MAERQTKTHYLLMPSYTLACSNESGVDDLYSMNEDEITCKKCLKKIDFRFSFDANGTFVSEEI